MGAKWASKNLKEGGLNERIAGELTKKESR